jgi:hypothetical protein
LLSVLDDDADVKIKPLKSFVDQHLGEITNSIHLNSISRPFIMILRNLQFPKMLNLNSLTDSGKENLLILTIKVQVYIGSQPFSKPKLIKWTGYTANQNPLFNKKLFFDLKYSNLPLFSGLLFQIRHIKLNKKQEIDSQNIIAWGNFRLFDHNKRLKTGK